MRHGRVTEAGTQLIRSLVQHAWPDGQRQSIDAGRQF
jgi:hypothetical protein